MRALGTLPMEGSLGASRRLIGQWAPGVVVAIPGHRRWVYPSLAECESGSRSPNSSGAAARNSALPIQSASPKAGLLLHILVLPWGSKTGSLVPQEVRSATRVRVYRKLLRVMPDDRLRPVGRQHRVYVLEGVYLARLSGYTEATFQPSFVTGIITPCKKKKINKKRADLVLYSFYSYLSRYYEKIIYFLLILAKIGIITLMKA